MQIIQAVLFTIAYALVTVGAYLLFLPILKSLWLSIRVESEHRKRLSLFLGEKNDPKWMQQFHKINQYVEMMLRATKKSFKPHHVMQFWLLFFGLGLSVGIFMYQWSQSSFYGMWTGFFVSMGYGLHHMILLRKIRIQAGYELVDAIGILNVRYKTERYNMERALTEAAKEITSPLIRQHFFNIVKAKKNGTDMDLHRALETFQFAIHTKFASHLSNMLHRTLDSKENIETTLMALDQNIIRNVNVIKAESSTQAELLQFKWFHLIAFPLTILSMIQWLGWDSWVVYQLGSVWGQLLFMLSVSSIVAVFFAANWFRDTPNDY